MAGHEWEDWFEREEFIGQISDIRVQNLQVEREVVQKRTFTRWMNLHLEKCNPPMEVKDLFGDIQDGRILMALLEELSGCKLLHGFKKSAHRIFRLNNIAKVLAFLEERNVKLVSIDAADVADGNASIVLGLIWNIILFFQIKELTGNIRSQFPSSSSLSSIPTSSDSDTSHSSTPSEDRRPSAAMRDHGKAIKTLLQWVQRRTRKYGVAVHDFGKSWSSGLAFLAVIKSIDPSLVDMRKSLLRPARENLEDAFRTAHYSLGIARLLEPEDVTINPPDEQSIMTYVSQFLAHFPGIEERQDVSEVIERSVSMGRLSSRSSDSELVRNGIHRGRQHDRPYVVRKDWVQTPPKIFISSVSEDKGVTSPTTLTSGNCSWANQDPSVGSSPGPGEDPQDAGKEVFTIRTSNSPQPCYVDSIVESSAVESVIGDSAIGSPDSWVDNEVPTMDGFVESRSDGSLCDSGVAWDANIPPTTPEEVAFGEGLSPLITGKSQDEQSQPELFIDEGVYSLSSVDSTLERANHSSDKQEWERKEEDAHHCVLDLNENGAAEYAPDQKQTLNKTEDSEQRYMRAGQLNGTSCEKQTSLELSDTSQQSEPEGTSQSQHSPDRMTPESFEQTGEQDRSAEESTDRNSECVNAGIGFSRNLQEVDTEEMSSRELCECPSQSDGSEKAKMEIASATGEEERLNLVLNEVTQRPEPHARILQEVPNGHIEPQEVTATQSGNVPEQTETGTHVDKDQIWTSQVQLSEPGLDVEDNHAGHYTTSETPTLTTSDSSLTLEGDNPLEETTRRLGRESHDVDEDTGQHGSSEKEMVGHIDGSPEEPESTSTKATDSYDSPAAETQQGASWMTHTQQETSASPVERANHLCDVEITEVTEIVQDSTILDHSLVDPQSLNPSTGKEGVEKGTASQPDGDQEAIKATTVDNSAGNTSDAEQGQLTLRELYAAAMQHKVASESMDLFYSENDQSSPLEEPMSELLEPASQPDGDQEAIKATTVDDTAGNTSNAEQGELTLRELYAAAIEHKVASESMDLSYSENDQSSPLEEPMSELLEPMDLFYPDTDEAVLPNQPEREDGRFSSLSVLALQPAPASEPRPDTHLQHLAESPDMEHLQCLEESPGVSHSGEQPGDVGRSDDTKRTEDETQHEQEKMIEKTKEGPGRLFEPQERCAVPRGTSTGGWGVLEADSTDKRGDLTHTDMEKLATARENMESVSWKEGESPAAECVTPVSELYVLLLLWLLVYCLMLLQQLDVRSLPGLLLNLED